MIGRDFKLAIGHKYFVKLTPPIVIHARVACRYDITVFRRNKNMF